MCEIEKLRSLNPDAECSVSAATSGGRSVCGARGPHQGKQEPRGRCLETRPPTSHWHRTARAAKRTPDGARRGGIFFKRPENLRPDGVRFSGHRQGVGMLGPISGQRLQRAYVYTLEEPRAKVRFHKPERRHPYFLRGGSEKRHYRSWLN